MAPWVRIPVNKVEAVWCFMALPDFRSTILIEAVIGFKERGTKTLPLSGKSAAMPSEYHQGDGRWYGMVYVTLWGLAPAGLSAHHSLTNCVLCFKVPGILATYNSLSSLSCLALLESFLCLESSFSPLLHPTNSYSHSSLSLSASSCRSPSMSVSLGWVFSHVAK